eukprot:6188808-Pleurochrysis_carterae.AAC.1
MFGVKAAQFPRFPFRLQAIRRSLFCMSFRQFILSLIRSLKARRLVSLLTGVISPTPHDGRQEPPSEIDPWLH